MSTEEKARDVLGKVLASTESDFYRTKYGSIGADVTAATKPWSDLPTLARTEIQSAAFTNRLYSENHRVDAIRPTSGTSGAGVLLMPRVSSSAKHAAIFKKHYEALGVRRALSFSGAQFLYAETFRPDFGIDTLAVDAGNLDLAARIVRSYKPDMVMGFAYVLAQFAPILKEMGLADGVKAVQVFGEWSSSAEWQHLIDAFPNAHLSLEYASIDAQTLLGMPCSVLLEKNLQQFHPVPEFVHFELLDREGKLIAEENVEGEVVITVLRDVAFPLIRYRTGDAAVIVSKQCSCDTGTPVIAMRGRIAEDRVRFYGGELSIAEIDRALTALRPRFHSDAPFTMHFKEVRTDDRPHPSIAIHTEWDKSISPEAFADALSHELRTNASYTYAMGVAAGDYQPLTAVHEPSNQTAGKRMRIVREQ